MATAPLVVRRLRAAKAYTDFTGDLPRQSTTVQLDDEPAAGYRLGSLVGVAYEATRDGITDKYFHRFARGARPDLVAKDDGSQLYITRGAYKVGRRGIEDMPPLMIVNPSSRPGLGRNSKGRFMRLATRRRRRRAPSQVAVFNRNPLGVTRRRRRRSVHRRRAAPAMFRANPIRRHRRRRASYRRNPTHSTAGHLRLASLIMPAASIGLGAIGSELAMGYLPLPANLKTGIMRHITKGAISLAAGAAIAQFVNRKVGEAFALGGLTIAFHDAFKDAIIQFMPTAQFGGMGYYSPGATVPMRHMNMNAYLPPRVGSPGGPTAFGVYMRGGLHGHASDGGPRHAYGT
jgi:hypothetical protein